ncbi:HD domain-containing protein [Flexithrix dorotheae]|uniref:HD domain-containing protein n=1 Tax=Flexithrix dorotheae TaxID=70993 RepID=UPI000368835C|nr:hypothetical protein [Flexithrix dorotheae]
MSEILKNYWLEIQHKIFSSEIKSDEVFKIVLKKLLEKNRFYHNQSHIEDMLGKERTIERYLSNPLVFKLSIWFHDIIYNPLKSDNEEKSADLAMELLKESLIPMTDLKLIDQFIMATHKHQLIFPHPDLPYFLDLDLSILGSPTENYKIYMAQIRKEYRHVPGFLYKKGRKKVLKSFLEKEEIYFSGYFKNLYEEKARENLKFEIQFLSN